MPCASTVCSHADLMSGEADLTSSLAPTGTNHRGSGSPRAVESLPCQHRVCRGNAAVWRQLIFAGTDIVTVVDFDMSFGHLVMSLSKPQLRRSVPPNLVSFAGVKFSPKDSASL